MNRPQISPPFEGSDKTKVYNLTPKQWENKLSNDPDWYWLGEYMNWRKAQKEKND